MTGSICYVGTHLVSATLFRVTTWGGKPRAGDRRRGRRRAAAASPSTEADIQPWSGQAPPRPEAGSRRSAGNRTPFGIQSGVFAGQDDRHTDWAGDSRMSGSARSRDYGEIVDSFRPGHADYTYWKKYGIRDYRGGGRSSARETAMRVAAGAIARKVLGDGVSIRGALVQLGPHEIDRSRWDWSEVSNNPFWCPDPVAAQEWETYLDGIRKSGSSAGAVIELTASGYRRAGAHRYTESSTLISPVR